MYLVEEVNVSGGQPERLYLAELVGWQSGNDAPECREGVVQALGSLPLSHVGQHPLVVQLFHAVADAAVAMPGTVRAGPAKGIRIICNECF
ncbi:hypothetical protein CEXT_216231 [Caerostris extrusa]|uniref:Uncharacterized protein n=1 Tax=Caerostris extrusa TaxID=172846 RepID=A0AAV4U961_CAEEX|nr:hypothetical protein CEXT_216231 [Caerostris extrusa]